MQEWSRAQVGAPREVAFSGAYRRRRQPLERRGERRVLGAGGDARGARSSFVDPGPVWLSFVSHGLTKDNHTAGAAGRAVPYFGHADERNSPTGARRFAARPVARAPSAGGSNGMAVAAMVCGIVAVATAWVPLFGILGLIAAIVALALGIPALADRKSVV